MTRCRRDGNVLKRQQFGDDINTNVKICGVKQNFFFSLIIPKWQSYFSTEFTSQLAQQGLFLMQRSRVETISEELHLLEELFDGILLTEPL